MSKHHKEKESAQNLGELMKKVDLNQVSSLLEDVDLQNIDMNKINDLMNNMGLANIDEEKLNELASNFNLGDLNNLDLNNLDLNNLDLNNLDLNNINSEDINKALNNFMDQLENINVDEEALKGADPKNNNLTNTLNEMLKNMADSEAYKQLTEFYSQNNKK